MSDPGPFSLGGALPTPSDPQTIAAQAQRVAALLAQLRAADDTALAGGYEKSSGDGDAQTDSAPDLNGFSLDPLNEAAFDLCKNWEPHNQTVARSTCVSFAVLAMIELRERLRAPDMPHPDYSEEFLYATMREDYPPHPEPPNYATGSTYMDQAMRALAECGICDEAAMPYNTATTEPAHVEPRPPDAKEAAEDRIYAAESFEYFRLHLDENGNDATNWPQVPVSDFIRRALQMGNPVSAAFPFYRGENRWYAGSDGWQYGVVNDPSTEHAHVSDAHKQAEGGHAVCIFGYREGEDGSDGRFYFRNSWGEDFAWDYDAFSETDKRRVPRTGYGSISASHVDNHCWEFMVLKAP